VQLIQNLFALHRYPKGHVLAIELLVRLEEDPEFSSVGVGSTVDHAQHIGLSMLHLEIFIVEFFSINGSESLSCLCVAVLFDFVKGDGFEAFTLLSSA
jgi:hypothetical protein